MCRWSDSNWWHTNGSAAAVFFMRAQRSYGGQIYISVQFLNYMKNDRAITAVFTGGGTGGHIYPGLAVADELRKKAAARGKDIFICWIGSASGMDGTVVEKNVDEAGGKSADAFYGIPAGKLRRYFSLKTLSDMFKVVGGFFASLFILIKLKPVLVFSKGGFVSVPPCAAAKLLGIPVYTHECDFTPGLATKINSVAAFRILVSYKETEKFFKPAYRKKIIVTGNPVREAFYRASPERGRAFLHISGNTKPVLLVIGGSSGAVQINELVRENLDRLCASFFVVHQTGVKNADSVRHADYAQYPFLYSEMSDVIAASDIVLSRAGANSIWECAVLKKPLVLIPLTGSGTRGDQEDNARYFEERGAAVVLSREKANSEELLRALEKLLSSEERRLMSENCAALVGCGKPSEKIAEIVYTAMFGGS